MKMNHKSRRSGFTLLELLIVVGILVMLAAFALPSFMGTQKQAQTDTATAQLATFEDALRIYQSQNGTYPTTEQGLQALIEKPESKPAPKRWAGPYLTTESYNDPWGNSYQYAYPGEHNGKKKPDIWSFGPDGEEGTDDDINNWKKGAKSGGDDEGSTKESSKDRSKE